MPSRIDQMATIRRFVVFRCFRSNSVGLWHKVNRKLHEKNIVKPSTTPLLIRRSVHSCSEGVSGKPDIHYALGRDVVVSWCA